MNLIFRSEVAMSEREELTMRLDALVDTYHGGSQDIHTLLDLRREIAVTLYRLTTFVRDLHGAASLGYARRKWAVAKEVVAAMAADAKVATIKAEFRAETLAAVQEARTSEVWAEADREALKAKLEATRHVLQAMQQEIAYLTHEAKTTNFQETHTQ